MVVPPKSYGARDFVISIFLYAYWLNVEKQKVLSHFGEEKQIERTKTKGDRFRYILSLKRLLQCLEWLRYLRNLLIFSNIIAICFAVIRSLVHKNLAALLTSKFVRPGDSHIHSWYVLRKLICWLSFRPA